MPNAADTTTLGEPAVSSVKLINLVKGVSVNSWCINRHFIYFNRTKKLFKLTAENKELRLNNKNLSHQVALLEEDIKKILEEDGYGTQSNSFNSTSAKSWYNHG